MNNNNSVALVTGASSGIGRAIASKLATDGMTVIAAARRTDRLRDLAAEVDGIEPYELDVTDRDAMKAAVDHVVARHGRLDILVANAGVMPLSRLDAGLVDEWNQMIDVNVRGLLHGIAAALPQFTTQQRGHVVTVASVGAHEVVPTSAVYSGTKFAAWAITEGLRLESPPWLRVTTISPGGRVNWPAASATRSPATPWSPTAAMPSNRRPSALPSPTPSAPPRTSTSTRSSSARPPSGDSGVI